MTSFPKRAENGAWGCGRCGLRKGVREGLDAGRIRLLCKKSKYLLSNGFKFCFRNQRQSHLLRTRASDIGREGCGERGSGIE